MKKKTNEQFILDSVNKHGNKYDYSKVNYINSVTPIIITCKKHGEFNQTPDIHINQKCGCPHCINKTEFIFYSKMSELYPTIKRQLKVEWCKNKQYLPFDFCVEEYKIIIEIDGQQHFKQISNWTSPEIQIEKDKYKMNCANVNGFSVIRILQQDIIKNGYNWLEEIKNNIEKIVIENIVQNIFMCKNNEYNLFL
jgi:very-short-patch-repair endonuclease